MTSLQDSSQWNMQGGHGQLVNVQTMHPALAAVLAACVILSLVFSFAAYQKSLATDDAMKDRLSTLRTDFGKVEREAKIMQIEVQNQSALLLREGLKLPTDSEHGPAHNLQYNRKVTEYGRNSLHRAPERVAAVRPDPPQRRTP